MKILHNILLHYFTSTILFVVAIIIIKTRYVKLAANVLRINNEPCVEVV
jgi:hypothetical protein